MQTQINSHYFVIINYLETIGTSVSSDSGFQDKHDEFLFIYITPDNEFVSS